jgi:hypothetical protein
MAHSVAAMAMAGLATAISSGGKQPTPSSGLSYQNSVKSTEIHKRRRKMTKLYNIIGRIATSALLVAALLGSTVPAAAQPLGTPATESNFFDSVWAWIGTWLPSGSSLPALLASSEDAAASNNIGATEDVPPPAGFGYDPQGRSTQ